MTNKSLQPWKVIPFINWPIVSYLLTSQGANKERNCKYMAIQSWYECRYRSGMVNSNTVNSKFRLIRSYCEVFFYNFPNIPCLKCTVNSNFHLIRSKTLPTNEWLRINRSRPVMPILCVLWKYRIHRFSWNSSRPCTRDETSELHWITFHYQCWIYTESAYRSGTVNSKSFVGKVLLRIKWKFELTVHFKHELLGKW